MKKKHKYLLLSMIILLGAGVLYGQLLHKNKETVSSEVQIDNLEKLCKVWGYVKYRHSAFLSGELDWDAKLMEAIDPVMKADSAEVNTVLEEWFLDLGDNDYGTDIRNPEWARADEKQKVSVADLKWVEDETYLGKSLSKYLLELGEIPNIGRLHAPVTFDQVGVCIFDNEKSYENMDYSDIRYRLTGLFRVWNAVEYFFPYKNVIDEKWEDILDKFIAEMLEGNTQRSYELTLASMLTILQEAHVYFLGEPFLLDEFGRYAAPVRLIYAEKQIVVKDIYEKYLSIDSGDLQAVGNCTLKSGDIILEVNGQSMKEIINQRKQYIAVPQDDKLINKLGAYLLRSPHPDIRMKILRKGEEISLKVKGVPSVFDSAPTAKDDYELLQNGIGIINPGKIMKDEIPGLKTFLKKTRGVIIDLRQYPNPSVNSLSNLVQYFVDEDQIYAQFFRPAAAVPGMYLAERPYRTRGCTAIYEYPIVVLIDETTQSHMENIAMELRLGKNVTLIGRNTVGSASDVSFLPLPGGNMVSFSNLAAVTPDGKQIQRIGIEPDIYVEPSIKNIRLGKDEMLERAVSHIEKLLKKIK